MPATSKSDKTTSKAARGASACDSLKESLALCQRLPTVPVELRDSVRSLVRDLIERRPTDGRIAQKRG